MCGCMYVRTYVSIYMYVMQRIRQSEKGNHISAISPPGSNPADDVCYCILLCTKQKSMSILDFSSP